MLKTAPFSPIHIQNPIYSSQLLAERLSWSRSSKESMAPAKIAAEYAKSSRSSCKKCSKAIPASSLRLGVVSRDPRGFDATKWHHLGCFPRDSHPIVAAEKIAGFSVLKGDDQARLKEMEAKRNVADREEGVEIHENKMDLLKVHGGSEVLEVELDQRVVKKQKPCEDRVETVVELSFKVADVKNHYKDVELVPGWKAFHTLIFLEQIDNLRNSEKIAAFDFDGCLVNTSVKRIGPDAWSLLYPSIPEKLQKLHNEGYKLVIFTNESNIERWKNKRKQAVDSKIGRLINFMKCVEVPIQVFIACGLGNTKVRNVDIFRKPQPGMWVIMEKHFNSGITVDMNQSFYVGDAAGRANDHSDADKKFAEAVGLRFYLPEEFFGA